MTSSKTLSSSFLVMVILSAQIALPYSVYAEELEENNETASTHTNESTSEELAETDEESTSSSDIAVEDGEGGSGEVDEHTTIENEESMTKDEEEVNEESTQEGGEGKSSETLEIETDIDDDMSLSSTSISDSETSEKNQNELLSASSSDADAATLLSSVASSTTSTDPIIESGTAVALANILNLVNTNFVNSNGVVLFSNLFESLFGTIDFRSYFDNMFGSSTCSLTNCSDEQVTVNLANNASIQNALLLQALSGGNYIDANGGNATIDSGNAYAGANIINVANTNLVDSNYLLVTLNAFEDVNGDIVFPSLSEFFRNLRGGASPDAIEVTSTADVENGVNVSADSGSNTTEDTDSSHINTGDAHTATNVFNEINTSLVGGESISVIFRVHGSWAGEIFGAPDDLGWITGEDGSLYLFDLEGDGTGNGHNVSVDADNEALISNNVSVVALTGENHITGADTALISTGNAYAGANIINVANANIVGRNWILAIINIFGDFNGNIAFGRPDLWIGEQVEVPNNIKDGSELTYRMTVINNGDSKASNVTLSDTYDANHIEIIESSLPYTTDGNTLEFTLEDLPAGGAIEVHYRAKIQNAGYGTEITNTVSVSGHETDNNTEDNTDTVTVRTEERSSGSRIKRMQRREDASDMSAPQLSIERTSAQSIVEGDMRASVQSLVVRNTSDTPAKGIVLHDILTDPNGAVIQDEVWEFGDILPKEEIQIGYTITFKYDAKPGRYAFNTTLEGSNLPQFGEANGFIDLAELAILPPKPEIAGASISITDRPSPLRPEDSYDDFISPLIPQALAAEEGATLTKDNPRLHTHMPYVATVAVSIIILIGAAIRRIRGHHI